MISKLSKNKTLKKYFKKPTFVSVAFLKDNKQTVLKDKNKFLKTIKQKKFGSDKILHLYIYLEYLLEKENKHSSFLLNHIHSKLFLEKMYIYSDIIIDREIYNYLKKEYSSFKEIREKKLLIILDKDYELLVKKLVAVENENIKNLKALKRKINNLVDYLNNLILRKKINKVMAKEILLYLSYSTDAEILSLIPFEKIK